MELFWKTTAAVLISAILLPAIEKQEKDLSVLLNMAVSCMCIMVVFHFLEPVLDFIRELELSGNFPRDMLDILLKAVGIGLTAELASLICADAGCGSLGKSIQMLGNCVILYISIPVFQNLLRLMEEILGEL